MATTHKESTLILGGRPRNLRKCETTDRQKMMAGDEGMQNGAYSFFLPPEIKHSGRRPVHLKGYASRFEYSKFSASRHGLMLILFCLRSSLVADRYRSDDGRSVVHPSPHCHFVEVSRTKISFHNKILIPSYIILNFFKFGSRDLKLLYLLFLTYTFLKEWRATPPPSVTASIPRRQD
jgi:hypothetical protein